MLEYVFFDPRPRDHFVAYVRENGLQPVLEEDDGLLKVLLPEEIDDAVAGLIEDCYDEMMEMGRELYEQDADAEEVGYHAAGITVQLADGSSVYAQVDPNLLGRIMQVVSPEEFSQVVDAIVEAVENPDRRTLCQRMRDGD